MINVLFSSPFHRGGNWDPRRRGDSTKCHTTTQQLKKDCNSDAFDLEPRVFSKCFKVTLQTNYIYLYLSIYIYIFFNLLNLKKKKLNHFYSICYSHTVVYILRPDGKITNSPFQHSHKLCSHFSTQGRSKYIGYDNQGTDYTFQTWHNMLTLCLTFSKICSIFFLVNSSEIN